MTQYLVLPLEFLEIQALCISNHLSDLVATVPLRVTSVSLQTRVLSDHTRIVQHSARLERGEDISHDGGTHQAGVGDVVNAVRHVPIQRGLYTMGGSSKKKVKFQRLVVH